MHPTRSVIIAGNLAYEVKRPFKAPGGVALSYLGSCGIAEPGDAHDREILKVISRSKGSVDKGAEKAVYYQLPAVCPCDIGYGRYGRVIVEAKYFAVQGLVGVFPAGYYILPLAGAIAEASRSSVLSSPPW